MKAQRIYAVIMAGGAGTRFWPASREKNPKQLLPLAGTQESLLAATVRRLGSMVSPDDVFVATGAHLVEQSMRVLPQVPRANFLAEPAPRNTAPCIGWATATIARRDPRAVIAVLPSDQYVVNEDAFRSVLHDAVAGAASGALVTIGIQPTRPETGYGYIELGNLLSGQERMYKVLGFVEKPDHMRAEAIVRGKRHLWNSGMFFFVAQAMLDAIAKHMPSLSEGLGRIDAAAKAGHEADEVRAVFPGLAAISIDHGVMEKAENLGVVRGDELGWSDVGSWQTAWELSSKDDAGNALPPGAVAVDARNNLVWDLRPPPREGERRPVVALAHVSDLVVVQTSDATLVIPRERAQEVRAVVQALRARSPEYL